MKCQAYKNIDCEERCGNEPVYPLEMMRKNKEIYHLNVCKECGDKYRKYLNSENNQCTDVLIN